MASVSHQTRNTWEGEYARAWRNQWYFDGLVFEERVADETLPQNERPLLFPVAINLVKMLCVAHADAAYGEWEERPVSFIVRKDLEPTDADIKAIQFLHTVLDASSIQSMLWELELDRQIYGGSAFRINARPNYPERFRLYRMPKYNFYPVWDPDDPDRLLEAYTITALSQEQAKAKYGFTTTNDYVNRVEHWTMSSYTTYIDREAVAKESGVNTYNALPFQYIPRFRQGNWYGESLTQEITQVQDEMNIRVADIGDAINYNTHPIRWGVNMPRAFNSENFPLGHNAFWDFGRSLRDMPKPEVGMLQVQNPVPQGAMDHINFLYDWSRTSSFAPPIAFGEDNGGGQRSGITLEIRMWPLIKSIRRGRSYMSVGLSRTLKTLANMMKMQMPPEVSREMIESIETGRIVPSFAHVMPRDRAALVDEIVKLLSTEPKSISLETAQGLLGRGPAEVLRIINMLADDKLYRQVMNAIGEEDGEEEDAEENTE